MNVLSLYRLGRFNEMAKASKNDAFAERKALEYWRTYMEEIEQAAFESHKRLEALDHGEASRTYRV